MKGITTEFKKDFYGNIILLIKKSRGKLTPPFEYCPSYGINWNAENEVTK